MGAHSTLDPSLSFEQLKRKYAAALREWDERPPEFVPRRRITAAGAALLYRPDLDDAAEIAAREAREAERRAARELRERQRQHPLYHTHHREQLLREWKEHGEPYIPPKALHGFTQWVMRHADATEDDVRQHAKTLEKAPTQTIVERLGKYADGFYRDKDPTELTQRNLRSALRKAFGQFNEQSAHILGIVGKNGQRYVSTFSLNRRRSQLYTMAQWVKATTVNSESLPKPIPLANCIRTPDAQFAELYTLIRGQESYFASMDYAVIFATFTAPAKFHPNPTHGAKSWDGSNQTETHNWLTETWKRSRYALKHRGIRLEGFRVTEPHMDGTEHWHVLIYTPLKHLDTIKSVLLRYFGHSEHAVTFKTDFPKMSEKGKATAAGYMLKYIIKTVGDAATAKAHAANDPNIGNDAEAAAAWRSVWRIRAFQFFGTLFGKQTLWRELRRIDRQPDDPTARRLWRAARGGRAHDFIATLREAAPDVAGIREVKTVFSDPDPETGEIKADYKPGRVVGVQINGIEYITHHSRFTLETDYAMMNEDGSTLGITALRTVIPKAPRGGMEGSPFAHAPPNAPPGTAAA